MQQVPTSVMPAYLRDPLQNAGISPTKNTFVLLCWMEVVNS